MLSQQRSATSDIVSIRSRMTGTFGLSLLPCHERDDDGVTLAAA